MVEESSQSGMEKSRVGQFTRLLFTLSSNLRTTTALASALSRRSDLGTESVSRPTSL